MFPLIVTYVFGILLRFPLGFISTIWIVIIRGFGTVLPQKYLSQVIDAVSVYMGGSQHPISLIMIPFIKLLVFKIVITLSFRLWQYFYFCKSDPQIAQIIKSEGVGNILKQSPRYFYNYHSGYLSSRLNDLVSGTCDLIESFFGRSIPTILNIVVPTIHLYTISPLIGIYALVPVVFLIIGIWWSVAKLKTYGEQYYETGARVDGRIVDVISNILTTKFYNTQAHETKGVHKEYGKVAELKKKISFTYMIMFITSNDVFGLSLLILSAYLAFQQLVSGYITKENFIFILIQVLHIGSEVWLLLFAIPDLIQKYQKASFALDILTQEPDIVEKKQATDLELTNGVIEFDSVFFGYPGKDTLFKGMNIRIEARQKIALVGSSGSGKSTFMNLILRLYDVNAGSIKIDGQDIRDVTLRSIYKNMAVVPQNPMLMNRSILENIKYGNSKAINQDVIEAAKQASIHDFIDSLPQKYYTKTDELSGGQKQRVAFARAFLKVTSEGNEGSILLIDEGTSQVDSVTEAEIQESLNKLMDERTVILIAHRLSTIQCVDRILVFKDGEIIEDGTHKELLKLKQTYYNLWTTQSNGMIGNGQ